ncbi:PiggyBac transposable element-derived protein [Trichinella spiralis]|uniref:PiggyBac transposable element-derived protein n=1 Tax=Trichinella spiralis TaxID=6334 RepID=A0ABR3KD76_TRISP
MEPDLTVDAASKTMSRNRFHQLKRLLHFSDNQNLSSDDEMSKVSPLYQMLNDLHSEMLVYKGKADSRGLQGLDALWHGWLSLPPNIYQGKEPSPERALVSE